jgi:hypothetical protein
MRGSRTTARVVLLLVLFVSLAAAGFYYLDWEKPTISLDKSFDAIGKAGDVIITLHDKQSGIRNFSVALVQDKHEFVIASEEIPFKGAYEKVVAVKIVPRNSRSKMERRSSP